MTTKGKDITILRVSLYNWIIPMFGNKHYCPYGTLKVEYRDNTTNEKGNVFVGTKGDMVGDVGGQYVSIFRHRYAVINKGSLYYPKIELKKMQKEVINRKTYWHKG